MGHTIDGKASESNEGGDHTGFTGNQLRQPPLFR
jgi:hypothetical protein